jgi:hypothetical protein
MDFSKELDKPLFTTTSGEFLTPRQALALAVVEELLEDGPTFATLKKHKVKLEPEERAKAIKAGAVWHKGQDGEPTCAIWKSVVNGKTHYGSNTHRCFQSKPTLAAAIKAFHDVVEPSA